MILISLLVFLTYNYTVYNNMLTNVCIFIPIPYKCYIKNRSKNPDGKRLLVKYRYCPNYAENNT